MLAAMEDLLDTWPGTLIVISHDRYFTERVTDHQFAVLGGTVRHLPGGVDEYLRLAQQAAASGSKGSPTAGAHSTPGGTAAEATGASGAPAAAVGGAGGGAGGSTSGTAGGTLSGAELRALQKELSALERRMEKLQGQIEAVHERMAAHDQSDFTGLAELSDELRGLEDELAQREERWLELSEELG